MDLRLKGKIGWGIAEWATTVSDSIATVLEIADLFDVGAQGDQRLKVVDCLLQDVLICSRHLYR